MTINELLHDLSGASYTLGQIDARYQTQDEFADAEKLQAALFAHVQAEAEARALVDAAIKEMQDRITELEAENVQFRVNLSTRDYFIVSKDLWPEFTSQLPTKSEFEAMIADEIARRNLNKAKGVEE